MWYTAGLEILCWLPIFENFHFSAIFEANKPDRLSDGQREKNENQKPKNKKQKTKKQKNKNKKNICKYLWQNTERQNTEYRIQT